MASKKERICIACGKVSLVFSRSFSCLACSSAASTSIKIQEEQKFIILQGYEILDGPGINKFGKREYSLLTPCGHTWHTRVDNFRKQIKHAGEAGLRPCRTCGGQSRMSAALKVYIEKHGRNYNINEWNDYKKLVRKLSDLTYRQYENEINPLGYKRGKKDWHLDHIVPIIECFKRGISPELSADRTNLQMLKWNENLKKSNKITKD